MSDVCGWLICSIRGTKLHPMLSLRRQRTENTILLHDSKYCVHMQFRVF